VDPIPDIARSPLEAVELARRLVDEGRAFSAHEVLESQWKHCPPEQQDLWQGLAQLCVAVTHAGRGNSVGAASVLQRAQVLLAHYQDSDGPTYGVDLTREWEGALERVSAESASRVAPFPASADGSRQAST
jgi:predicted metal-dependent hydrolase